MAERTGEMGEPKKTAEGGDLLTSAEAARLVGLSARVFIRAARRTGLRKHPASTPTKFRYSRESVLAWLRLEEPESKGGEA